MGIFIFAFSTQTLRDSCLLIFPDCQIPTECSTTIWLTSYSWFCIVCKPAEDAVIVQVVNEDVECVGLGIPVKKAFIPAVSECRDLCSKKNKMVFLT